MRLRLKCIVFLLFIFVVGTSSRAAAQKYTFTHDDTLRGSITPERAWWDLAFYRLRVDVNIEDSTIKGQNEVQYRVLKPYQTLQIDLQRPLKITKITQDGQPLVYKRDGDAFLVTLTKPQQTGNREAIVVFYEGRPRVAKRPPWDGGFTWKYDSRTDLFAATSCQSLGASAWWPCKDHMYDECDSMAFSATLPVPYMAVSNGRLKYVSKDYNRQRTFEWFVKNPINNYGVNLNIGSYVHWSEVYQGEKGPLDMDFYCLPENVEKAKVQFKQAHQMMRAFEHWFGPYPFYEDGYKLVEVPYLGMEHQSSVTYGNGFENGYLGSDLSGTGWGLKWDFIIVHESGHEWFANNITYKDVADMWIHESFTNYSESLFTEFYYGKEAGAAYAVGCRKRIRNDKPIIGIYNVNKSGSGDMYYKGGNMLHTIRQVVNDDEKWRQILRGLNKTFYHQTVTTQQIETFMSQQAGRDLGRIFDQYLRDVRIPVLEYKIQNGKLTHRWANCVADFDMPIKANGQFLYPATNWKTEKRKIGDKLEADVNFYVETRDILKPNSQ